MPREMRWDCQQKCYLKSAVPNWTFFDDCFSRGAGIGDVDGMIESNGRFLFFEIKNESQPEIEEGQLTAYKRLTNKSDDIMVLYLRTSGDDSQMDITGIAALQGGMWRYGYEPWRETNTREIAGLLTLWFR